MIEVLSKLWWPKGTSQYRTSELDDDVSDIRDYAQCGKCTYNPKLDWSVGAKRDNLILFDCAIHTTELKKIWPLILLSMPQQELK